MPIPSLEAFEAQMAGLNIPPGDPRYAAMKQNWLERLADQSGAPPASVTRHSMPNEAVRQDVWPTDPRQMRAGQALRDSLLQQKLAAARGPAGAAGWDQQVDPAAIPAARTLNPAMDTSINNESIVQHLPRKKRNALAWTQNPEAMNRAITNLAVAAEFEAPARRVQKGKGRFIAFNEMSDGFQRAAMGELGPDSRAPAGWWSGNLSERTKQLVQFDQQQKAADKVAAVAARIREKAQGSTEGGVAPSGTGQEFTRRQQELLAGIESEP